MATRRTVVFGADSEYGTLTIKIRKAASFATVVWWNPTTNAWVTTEPTHAEMEHDSDLGQYYTEESPTETAIYSIFDSDGNVLATGEIGGSQSSSVTMYVASNDSSAHTIEIKKMADPSYWWKPSDNTWTTTEPSHATMTYDSDMRIHYTTERPYDRATYSIFDSSSLLVAYGDYNGGFPAVTSPSSTCLYTMQEVIDRIRVSIRDPGGDNPLFTDAALLNILDACNDWILDQIVKHQCDLGTKRATYDGDGSTTEWKLPTDFYAAFGDPLYPDTTNGGSLKKVTKQEYDLGILEDAVSYPTYYVLFGGNIYFIPDPLSEDIYLYYWGRNTKLEATSTVPWDGVFLTLMVEWGKIHALKADEFDSGFEEKMLRMFMQTAQGYMTSRAFRKTNMVSSAHSYLVAKGRRRRI